MNLSIAIPLTVKLSTTARSLDDMREAYDLDADVPEDEVFATVKRVTAEGIANEVSELLWQYGFEPDVSVGEVALTATDDVVEAVPAA